MIDWLLHLPAYSKVGVSFLGILLLNSSGVPLGLAILLFSVLLPLWAGTGMGGIYYQIASFGEPQNYILPVIILLLLFFTESLSKTGRMDRTIAALKEWLKSKHLILAGLPALVGLLPMPAGALFSAPFVAAVDESGELELSHKVAINYWFRHHLGILVAPLSRCHPCDAVFQASGNCVFSHTDALYHRRSDQRVYIYSAED